MNELGSSDLAAIAAFCERSVRDAPTAAELEGALFAPDQPTVVLGDPSVGVVAVSECSDGPHIRLLPSTPTIGVTGGDVPWCRRPRSGRARRATAA